MRTLSFLFLVVGAAGCGVFRGAPFAFPAPGVSPPAAVMDAVAERFPGATLAAPATCSGTTAAAASPFMVGDLNGDDRLDSILRITATDGPHLVVVFTRTADYDVAEITKGDAPGQLTLKHRGERYQLLGLVGDYYYSADTVLLTPCGGGPTAYTFTGSGFAALKVGPGKS